MTVTNRIEYKRELTPELDVEKEVVAYPVFCEHIEISLMKALR